MFARHTNHITVHIPFSTTNNQSNKLKHTTQFSGCHDAVSCQLQQQAQQAAVMLSVGNYNSSNNKAAVMLSLANYNSNNNNRLPGCCQLPTTTATTTRLPRCYQLPNTLLLFLRLP
jgi:hypothetical protein